MARAAPRSKLAALRGDARSLQIVREIPQLMKTIHMAIDPRLLRAVDKLTRARKTTRSALIRAAPGTTLSEGSI
jgi:hypothetical protein